VKILQYSSDMGAIINVLVFKKQGRVASKDTLSIQNFVLIHRFVRNLLGTGQRDGRLWWFRKTSFHIK